MVMVGWLANPHGFIMTPLRTLISSSRSLSLISTDEGSAAAVACTSRRKTDELRSTRRQICPSMVEFRAAAPVPILVPSSSWSWEQQRVIKVNTTHHRAYQ